MRKWDKNERINQSKIIKEWRPWLKGGVKTPEGKEISKMNALKHGLYSKKIKSIEKSISENLRNLRKYARGEK